MSRAIWAGCVLAVWAVGCTDDDTGGKETGSPSVEDQIQAGLFTFPASNAAVVEPEGFGQESTTFDGVTIGATFYMYVSAIDTGAETMTATTSWDTTTSATAGRVALPPASPTTSSCTGSYASRTFKLVDCTQYTTVDVPAEKLLPAGDGLMSLVFADIEGTFSEDGVNVEDGATVTAQLDLTTLDDDLERIGSSLCSPPDTGTPATLSCSECADTGANTCIDFNMQLGEGKQIEGESL